MLKTASKLMICYITIILGSCGRNEPPWKQIASSQQLAYVVQLKTFDSEGHADSPFQLGVAIKTTPSDITTLLKTTQCKNVEILAASNYLYIFYDRVALSVFSGRQSVSLLPRPLLCDRHHPVCRDLRKSLHLKGYSAYQICTYQTEIEE